MTAIVLKDRGGETMKAVDVGAGYLISPHPTAPEELKDIFDNMPNLTCRHDDVMISSYPKTGTNWIFEMTTMILQKSTAKIQTNKIQSMLEIQNEQDLQEIPNPRVLNSHLTPRFLPKDLARNQIKTILIVRNPKDTAVSYYHHQTGFNAYNYNGKWDDWLPLFIEGELEYGHYCNHLNEWAEVIRNGPPFPLHLAYYEDLKEHGVREIIRLSKFMGVDINDQLAQEINRACSFKKMADEKLSENVKKLLFTNNFEFFRKGVIGDWRNWFSQEQREQFDKAWNEKFKNSVFKFRYEPSPTSHL